MPIPLLSKRPWYGLVGLALLAGSVAYACVDATTTVTRPDFDRNALLASLTDNVLLVTMDDFIAEAQQLQQATAAYATTLSPQDREAAQQAWREAMAAWQRAEVMQVGPAGHPDDVAGGLDLRNAIYSWPIVNRCRVDQETVEGHYTNVAAFATEQANVRGLDALEYLLFNSATANLCPPQNVINESGAWDAVAGELEQRRADYASALAQLLVQSGVALRDAWTGGFAGELKNAGRGSGSYESAQAALNAVSDALFYIESETKDMKLAVPAGLADCDQATCPAKLELPLSGASKLAIEQNLAGFELLFMGGSAEQPEALGFDDWLVAYGAKALADKMRTRLSSVRTALAAIEEADLAAALDSDPESVVALYTALKGVTDTLKAEVVTVLDLDLPNHVQGDND